MWQFIDIFVYKLRCFTQDAGKNSVMVVGRFLP
jgi:hypothetical protein